MGNVRLTEIVKTAASLQGEFCDEASAKNAKSALEAQADFYSTVRALDAKFLELRKQLVGATLETLDILEGKADEASDDYSRIGVQRKAICATADKLPKLDYKSGIVKLRALETELKTISFDPSVAQSQHFKDANYLVNIVLESLLLREGIMEDIFQTRTEITKLFNAVGASGVDICDRIEQAKELASAPVVPERSSSTARTTAALSVVTVRRQDTPPSVEAKKHTPPTPPGAISSITRTSPDSSPDRTPPASPVIKAATKGSPPPVVSRHTPRLHPSVPTASSAPVQSPDPKTSGGPRPGGKEAETACCVVG